MNVYGKNSAGYSTITNNISSTDIVSTGYTNCFEINISSIVPNHTHIFARNVMIVPEEYKVTESTDDDGKTVITKTKLPRNDTNYLSNKDISTMKPDDLGLSTTGAYYEDGYDPVRMNGHV